MLNTELADDKYINDIENIVPILPASIRNQKYINFEREFFIKIFGEKDYNKIIEDLTIDNRDLNNSDYLFLIMASEMIGKEEKTFLNDNFSYVVKRDLFTELDYMILINFLYHMQKYDDLIVVLKHCIRMKKMLPEEIGHVIESFNSLNLHKKIATITNLVMTNINYLPDNLYESLLEANLKSDSAINLFFFIKNSMSKRIIKPKEYKLVINFFKKKEIVDPISNCLDGFIETNTNDIMFSQLLLFSFLLNEKTLSYNARKNIICGNQGNVIFIMKFLIENGDFAEAKEFGETFLKAKKITDEMNEISYLNLYCDLKTPNPLMDNRIDLIKNFEEQIFSTLLKNDLKKEVIQFAFTEHSHNLLSKTCFEKYVKTAFSWLNNEEQKKFKVRIGLIARNFDNNKLNTLVNVQ